MRKIQSAQNHLGPKWRLPGEFLEGRENEEAVFSGYKIWLGRWKLWRRAVAMVAQYEC